MRSVDPAARAAGRVAGEARAAFELLQPLRQRRPLGVGDRRGEADMVELARIVVEPEQQRADARRCPSRSGSRRRRSRRVRRRLTFSIARSPETYGPSRRLAMTPSSAPPALASHCGASAALAGVGREPQPRGFVEASGRAPPAPRGARRAARPTGLRRPASSGSRTGSGSPGVSTDELADPALGRMQAHLQRVEGQRVADRDRELAVEHEARRGASARSIAATSGK